MRALFDGGDCVDGFLNVVSMNSRLIDCFPFYHCCKYGLSIWNACGVIMCNNNAGVLEQRRPSIMSS